MENAMSAQTQSQSMGGAVAICMVKNEADIIEASIRHNLHYVDLVAVIDNGSTDGTRGILEALRSEGLPVLIFDDPIFGHFQSEKVTEVYRRVVTIYEPELVYLLDADEFIRASGRPQLEVAIRQVGSGGLALLPWETHIPDPESTPEQVLNDPLRFAHWRRVREEPVYYKAVICRRREHDLELVIEQGNHSAHLRDGRKLSAAVVLNASLVHLPVRSVDQISAKVINGWLACVVRNRTRSVPGEAYQWRHLYERITQGEGVSPEELTSVALNYAQTQRAGRSLKHDAVSDPVKANYGHLRFLGMGRHAPLAKVALSLSNYLADPTETAHPAEEAARTDAMDLAAVMYVLSESGAKSLIVADNTPHQRWESTVFGTDARLQHGAVHDAEALLATSLSGPEAARIMIQFKPAITRRVVYWMPTGFDASHLMQQLDAWAACGWEPDVGLTMAFRSLACFAEIRRGGVVLRPLDPAMPEKTKAVRGVLCSLAQKPFSWVDPAPQCISHPLQNVRFETDQGAGRADSDRSAMLQAEIKKVPDGRPAKMRVAVVTPYYKEPKEWLERCLKSVKAQDHACEHFVIADGYPQAWLDNEGVRHIKLDIEHRDYGNTPRSIGAQLAVAEGFDAVAFLDADNWYSSNHISSCVDAALRSGADYVVSRRTLNRVDESVLPWVSREDEVGEHVDTSCFFILGGAFHALPRWLMMPKPMSALGDRYFLKSLRDEGLREVQTGRKTVHYLCGWADVYHAVGEQPPPFAKGSLPLREISEWVRGLGDADRVAVARMSGCYLDPDCSILAKLGF